MDAFFKSKKILFFIFVICLALSLSILLPLRINLERNNRAVSAVISLEDVQALADNSGQELNYWLTEFKEMGFCAILVSEDDDISEITQSGLKPLLVGGNVDKINNEYINAYIADESTADAQDVLPELQRRGITLILVENRWQTGADLPEGWSELLFDYSGQMTKCFWLNTTFRARYATLGYDNAQEIENIFYRAATDRSIRLLWVAPFMNGEQMITDVSQYREVFQNLSNRIAAQGLTFGSEFTSLTPADQPLAPVMMLGFAICLLGIFLIWTLYPIKNRLIYPLILLSVISCALLTWFIPDFAISLFALAASITFPCWAIFETTINLTRLEDSFLSLSKILLYASASLLQGVLICLSGGLVIGAVIGSTDYLLELRLFTGVKLSQLVPLVYSVFIIFKFLYHEKGRNLKGDLKSIFYRFRDHGKLKVVLIALFLLLAVAVFIMRTGDGMLSVSAFEQRIRNWFENVLYARPRTKEFLIAFPACMLAILCASKGWKNALLPLGVLFSIGFTSICNTFCHGRAEISLSLIRTLIGFGFGLCLGIIAVAILYFIGQKLKGGGRNA